MKTARVYIYGVRVECPYCEADIPNDEGEHWNECVGGELGEQDCPECGKRIIIPPVYDKFGAPLRFRKKILK